MHSNNSSLLLRRNNSTTETIKNMVWREVFVIEKFGVLMLDAVNGAIGVPLVEGESRK